MSEFGDLLTALDVDRETRLRIVSMELAIKSFLIVPGSEGLEGLFGENAGYSTNPQVRPTPGQVMLIPEHQLHARASYIYRWLSGEVPI